MFTEHFGDTRTLANFLTLSISFNIQSIPQTHPHTNILLSRTGDFAGYWNVTLIPQGARHIRAAHRSRNHLGITGSEGKCAQLFTWVQPGD